MFQSEKVKTIEYAAGDYILREGAKCDALFVVQEGQIEIYRLDINSKKIPLGLVQSGEYLGEMSLISDRPHSAHAVALTKTRCVKITSEIMENQMKELPKWLVALTRGLVYKLQRTNEVLKRNGIADEALSIAVKAILDKGSQKPSEDDPSP